MPVASRCFLPLLLLLPSLVHPFLLPAAITISSPSRASSLRMAVTTAGTKGMQTVNVNLGDRSYPIYIGPGLLKQPELLTQHVAGKRCMVITNDVRLTLSFSIVADICILSLPLLSALLSCVCAYSLS